MDSQNTVTFHNYSSIAEATLILEKLRMNGINAFLNDENVLGLDPVGVVELRIFEKDLDEANKILSEE